MNVYYNGRYWKTDDITTGLAQDVRDSNPNKMIQLVECSNSCNVVRVPIGQIRFQWENR